MDTDAPASAGDNPLPKPTVEHRHPEWLTFVFAWGNPTAQSSNLHLTISFGRHYLETAIGEVHFGLRRGELRLSFENASLPLRDREPKGTLPVSMKVRKKETGSSSETVRTDLGASAGSGIKGGQPEFSGAVSANRSRESGYAHGSEQEFEDVEWFIEPKGADTAPIWDFGVKPGALVIRGSYHDFKLGVVRVRAKPVWVNAEFRVRGRDIQFLEFSNPLIRIGIAKLKLFGVLIGRHWCGEYLSHARFPFPEGER
jgi:hypothetical protein